MTVRIAAAVCAAAILATAPSVSMASRPATDTEAQAITSDTHDVAGVPDWSGPGCAVFRVSTVDERWATAALTNHDGCQEGDGIASLEFYEGSWIVLDYDSNVAHPCARSDGYPAAVGKDLRLCRDPTVMVVCHDPKDAGGAPTYVQARKPRRCELGNGTLAFSVDLRGLRWNSWGKSTAVARGVARSYRTGKSVAVVVRAYRMRGACGSPLDHVYTRYKVQARGWRDTWTQPRC